jgi:hypothetical protein
MSELITLINDYIFEQDPQYAILITGDWGCGKTFYWKNDIYNELDAKFINGSKVHPVYISLYGPKDIDEIIDKIVIQYHNPKTTKYAFFSAIRNYITNKLQIANFRDVVHTLYSFENAIICFDDLERSTIPIKDILGYINSIIEHNKFKVIIICNEKEIKNEGQIKKKDIYDNFKEKTIGITYVYNPDYLSIISAIIDKYKDNNNFANYLSEFKDIIYTIFKRSETNNIRVLKHALFNFLKIYYYLNAINQYCVRKYGAEILIFILVISLEIKAKNPEPNKLREIEAYAKDEYSYLSMMMMDRKEDTKIFNQEVIDKYYHDFEGYIYTSKTIYNYINYGYFNSREFVLDMLEKEMEKSEDPRKYFITKILGRFWAMSDNEFVETTSYVLNELVAKGQIGNIYLYNRLLLLYIYFIDNELFDFSKNELTDIFKTGMELAYSNGIIRYDKIDDSALYNIDKKYINDQNYKQIDIIRKDIELRTKEDWIKSKSINCFKMIDQNMDDFIKLINSDELDCLLRKPVYKFIDPEILFAKILNINNEDLIKFRNSIFTRYSIIDKVRDSAERNTLLVLKEKLELYISKRQIDYRLSTHLIKELISELETICNKNT